MKNWDSKYGHCVFLSTEKYKSMGGENEEFVAYGPEDIERYERFIKLDYKVDRVNSLVYHLEHSRTHNSWFSNPNFNSNNNLWNAIKTFDRNQMVSYYESQEYYKNRKRQMA